MEPAAVASSIFEELITQPPDRSELIAVPVLDAARLKDIDQLFCSGTKLHFRNLNSILLFVLQGRPAGGVSPAPCGPTRTDAPVPFHAGGRSSAPLVSQKLPHPRLPRSGADEASIEGDWTPSLSCRPAKWADTNPVSFKAPRLPLSCRPRNGRMQT